MSGVTPPRFVGSLRPGRHSGVDLSQATDHYEGADPDRYQRHLSLPQGLRRSRYCSVNRIWQA